MGIVVAPIVDGKLETWKQWAAQLQGPAAAEFADFNRRYGLTRHAAWLAETPAGPVVVALHEGPGADTFMEKVATSNHEVDVMFREMVAECHGMDLTQPPPGPAPELHIGA
ncbi:MAG: hypothetical protein ACE5HA_13535 [Anaerolineae bacterium]